MYVESTKNKQTNKQKIKDKNSNNHVMINIEQWRKLMYYM